MSDKIVFLTKLIPTDKYDETLQNSNNTMPDAANALKWNLLQRFSKNYNTLIYVINVLPIDSFPQYYRKAFVHREDCSSDYTKQFINVGFCNIKRYRKLSIEKSVSSELIKLCSDCSQTKQRTEFLKRS